MCHNHIFQARSLQSSQTATGPFFSKEKYGITYNITEYSTDCDYANEIYLLSHTHRDMQKKAGFLGELAS